jgi:hypothetical protein
MLFCSNYTGIWEQEEFLHIVEKGWKVLLLGITMTRWEFAHLQQRTDF